MSVTDLPKLYTDAEAAVSLRCSPMTVSRLRRSGKLGYTRVASNVYVTDAHIRDYLESQECAVTSSKETKTASGTSGNTTSELDNAAELALVQRIAQPQTRSLRNTSSSSRSAK